MAEKAAAAVASNVWKRGSGRAPTRKVGAQIVDRVRG
jgi:hypothetical protein